MNHKKLELLAPAGSFESLKAAVANGADAVYLGGGKFNARINAENFTEEDLARAMDYAHERDVLVYITLNTLLKNEELGEALKFAEFVYLQGADSIIVQDCGLIGLLRKYIPDAVIHASTQMTVTNAASVRALEKSGADRVVLARELSINEIKSISAQCEAELEVFVHGANCICYSGQCLMSSFIGGRSGNRGLCAQPCRLPWSLSRNGINYGKAAYLLSPRDLMALELLPQLKDAGVASLKLEGRMKSPEYVAIVTSVYRKYINIIESGEDDKRYRIEEKDKEKLLQAFNRGGFTRSYLEGDRNFKKLVYTRYPKNQGVQIGTVADSRLPYARIRLEKPLHMGDGIEIIDEERGPLSFIVTSIVQNGGNVRFAEAGTAPLAGDIKAHVQNGSRVFRTLSRPLYEHARKSYEGGEGRSVPVDMQFTLRIGEKARLAVRDSDGTTVTEMSEIDAEKAVKRPLSAERIKEQLNKTGDTPYRLRELKVDTDGESIIPISALNALRRDALEELKNRRIKGRKPSAGHIGIDGMGIGDIKLEGIKTRDIKTGDIKNDDTGDMPSETDRIRMKRPKNCPPNCPPGSLRDKKLSLSAWFNEAPAVLNHLNGLVSRVYLPVVPEDRLEKFRSEFEGEMFLWTPPILRDSELLQAAEGLSASEEFWDGVACGSPGALEAYGKAFPGKLLCADHTMNVFNDWAIEMQKDLGAQTVVISPELRLNEAESLSCCGLVLEAFIYGRVPLMTMEYCPSSAEVQCTGLCACCKGGRGYLKDRKGEVFPFVRDTALKRTRIYNSVPVWMDDTDALQKSPVNLLRLNFTDEDAGTCEAVARHFYNKLCGNAPDQADESIIEGLKSRGYTKGHWFRGV